MSETMEMDLLDFLEWEKSALRMDPFPLQFRLSHPLSPGTVASSVVGNNPVNLTDDETRKIRVMLGEGDDCTVLWFYADGQPKIRVTVDGNTRGLKLSGSTREITLEVEGGRKTLRTNQSLGHVEAKVLLERDNQLWRSWPGQTIAVVGA